MINSLVLFIGASFAGVGQRGLDVKKRGELLTASEERSTTAHRTQTEALTRLRMIAPGDVVAAAERPHEADHAVHAEVLHNAELPTSEHWTQLRRVQADARRSCWTPLARHLASGLPSKSVTFLTFDKRNVLDVSVCSSVRLRASVVNCVCQLRRFWSPLGLTPRSIYWFLKLFEILVVMVSWTLHS